MSWDYNLHKSISNKASKSDCVWSDWQNCVGGGGEHDQIGSGRDVNEVGY